MKIFSASCHKTNYYFIEADQGLLAIDCGWPGEFLEYARSTKEGGVRVQDIKWLIVTHFHIDHAGLAGELQKRGVEFIVLEHQVPHIDQMEELIARKEMLYTPIDRSKITTITLDQSPSWLQARGIGGQIINTNSHSPDSISVILNDGSAFIGDLWHPNLIMEDDEKGQANWQALENQGTKQIYPAHGPQYQLPIN